MAFGAANAGKCLPLRASAGQSAPDFRANLIFMDTVNEQGCCKDAVNFSLFN